MTFRKNTLSGTGTALSDRLYIKKRKRRKRRTFEKRAIATAIAAFFAILFLMPIVLTVTNSFMSASEISSNYGQVFATTDTGGKTYISKKVNLKLFRISYLSVSILRCF